MPASIRASSTATPTAASFNVTKPAGTLQGDILIAFHSASEGTLANMGTPTGGATWVLLDSQNSGTGYDNKTKVWWKVAGGSEPANYAFTQNSLANGAVAIVAIMDADTTLTPVFAKVRNDTGSTSVPTPGITPAGPDDLELRWASANCDGDATTWTQPATYTERHEIQGASNAISACLAYKQLASGAATGSLNFTASISVLYRHGHTVAVASARAPGRVRPFVSTAAVRRAASW